MSEESAAKKLKGLTSIGEPQMSLLIATCSATNVIACREDRRIRK
jgi:hypothetical protein